MREMNFTMSNTSDSVPTDVLTAARVDIVYVCDSSGKRVSAIIPEADVALFQAVKLLRIHNPLQFHNLVPPAQREPMTLEQVVRLFALQHTRILDKAA